MLSMQTAPKPGERRLPVVSDRAYDYITSNLAVGRSPAWIAAGLRAYFEIEIFGDQVLACWNTYIRHPTRTEPGPEKESMQIPAVKAKDVAVQRMACADPPARITGATPAALQAEIAGDPARACGNDRDPDPTQTGHRQDDKESVQFPADAEKEPLFTVMAPDEAAQVPLSITPDPVCDDADGEAGGEHAQTTQTGRRQDEEESLQIPADTVDEPTARDKSLDALGAFVKARLGIASDPAPDPAVATRTGPGQNQKSTVLTDEVKTFIVRGLARYETPTRIAASVKTHFGIEIDRRQVFAYDPAGSRKPAQRWIDLHAATRVKFTRAMAEIGVAQKVVRLRMLDRLANRAEEANQVERACRILDQAARECGGFYERFQRPKAARTFTAPVPSAPGSPSGADPSPR
jgi:hypothetical protein